MSESPYNDQHIAALRFALELAVQQNSHDMLMTGEEIRSANPALLQARAALAKAKGEPNV